MLFGSTPEGLLTQTPSYPQPELIRALAELIKATERSSEANTTASWLTPDGLKALATFISAIAWPVLAFLLIFMFRPQVRDVIRGIKEFEIFGVKGKIQNEINQSAQAAEKSEGLSLGPTPGEITRAIQVDKLASATDLAFVRQQVDELAAEYERVRGSMRVSDTRTRAMEVVVSKMRTIGRAAYPLRHELSVSASPGHRLQAIASLQVMPDYDLLDWLANRIDRERPFVGYHALVALNTAAADERAAANLDRIENALAIVREKRSAFSRDTDRQRLVERLETQVKRLQKAYTRS